MGIISDKISWLRDGERANSTNFNRPLSQVVSEIENRLFNEDGTSTSSTLKRPFEASFKGTIVSGDFVYLDPNTGKLEKAIADGSEKANVLGIWQITRSQAGQEELSVATQGEVKIVGKTLEVGKNYYLSNKTAGDFSKDKTDTVIINLKTGIFEGNIYSAVAFQQLTDTFENINSFEEHPAGVHDALFKTTRIHDYDYMEKALIEKGML